MAICEFRIDILSASNNYNPNIVPRFFVNTFVSICKSECVHKLKLKFLGFSTSFNITCRIYLAYTNFVFCFMPYFFQWIIQEWKGVWKEWQSTTPKKSGVKKCRLFNWIRFDWAGVRIRIWSWIFKTLFYFMRKCLLK